MQQATYPSNSRVRPIGHHLDICFLQDTNEPEPLFSGTRTSRQYEIIFIQQGSGKLSVNLNEYNLDEQHIYFISPGQVRDIELFENITGFYLSVSHEFYGLSDSQLLFASMLQQCKGLGNAMIMQVDSFIRGDIEEILQKMHLEINREHSLKFELLQVYFRTLLLYLSKHYHEVREIDTRSNDIRIVKKFMQLVNNHFIQKKMVGDYADELCVTRSYLNKVVKKVSGFTASQLIQQRIIQEAKKQAIQSGTSMKQIAYGLGFDDCAHFSKFFKTNCGVNFTNYKKGLGAFQFGS